MTQDFLPHIAIIGAGFTGTMTAVQLIEQTTKPIKITLINECETLNKGIAYSPYSHRHLLNVVTAKMSAYPQQPTHFLEWVLSQPEFAGHDQQVVANSFLPRALYGQYLGHIWSTALSRAQQKQLDVQVIENHVADLTTNTTNVSLRLDNERQLFADYVVIASGNHLPRNPKIKNVEFYSTCQQYFQNPWQKEAVSGVNNQLPVLIVGNGLTMVDTVLGLLEYGFHDKIYSLSPNGFNILPHRHAGLEYTKLVEELTDDMKLRPLVALVNKHIKLVRNYGVSAEPIIDSIRPHTQRIWQQLTLAEKKVFMQRLRHLWGAARHRIPLHIHDKLQQLRIDGRLELMAGNVVDFREDNGSILVDFYDKKAKTSRQIKVGRIINCTGPESDLARLEEGFLKNCFLRGLITQDPLKLGIRVDLDNFAVLGVDDCPAKRLFTIGPNLKGQLWESIAVNELRQQAVKMADHLLQTVELSLSKIQ